MSRYNREARTKHSYQDVLAAVRAYVLAPHHAGRPHSGRFEMSQVIADVSAQLNGRWDEPTSWQARRALNALADGPGAILVKVPRGEPGPDGRRSAHTVIFWEPAAWDAALAGFGTWSADQAAVRDAWERVHDIVIRSGITPLTGRGEPVRVPLSGWAALTGLDPAGLPDDATAARVARNRP